MTRMTFLLLFLCVSPTLAAETLPPKAKVVKLAIAPEPAAMPKMWSKFDTMQLLVTATLDDGTTCDVTRIAKPAFENPKQEFATISPSGVLRYVGYGSGNLNYELDGVKASIFVSMGGSPTPPATSFVRDVMPLLGKLGCNAGTCHGAQAGKNGFKLSLRGYDPLFDHRALTDDLEGRRFNRAAPERSLMLMKTSGGVPHVGGVVMNPGEPNYELMKKWIAEGAKFDAETPRVKSLEIFPKATTIQRIGDKQQFRVVAVYPDGATRDVTQEAFLDSSNTEVATVDKTGLATSVRRGETTMLARYEGAYAASTVVVMGDRTGFEWKPQPVNNPIDELVDTKLKKLKVQLSDLCTDEEFIRRVTIDLTGLPPTADDVRKFIRSAKGSHIKRKELIDSLIGSETFVDHWTNKWSDLLQVNRKFLGQPGAESLRKWIRGAVAKNMPYDEFAYAILTGSGSNVTSPTASYFKILREPEDAMENTTQLFLAIRFNCNKCHDHPFERWTQDQYYQLSAYFAQVSRTEDPNYKNQKIGGTAVEKPLPLAEIIADVKEGDVKHARTGLVTAPAFPYPHGDMPAAAEPRRVQAAKWITSEKNPYFAKSYVNRIWSYLTGVGIIEPVDDIRAGNPPSNPELLDYLTTQFVKSNFNTQALIREICQSRTYQLSIATNAWNKDDDANYSHAIARRLPAEVLFDAVHQATGATSQLPGLPPGARAAQLIDSTVDLPGGFLDLLGKPVRESVCECERNSSMMLGPVLAFINGPVVGDAVQDANNRIARFTLSEQDDNKVVEEIYLSVFNRFPTQDEKAIGIKALRSAGSDYAKLVTEHKERLAKFAEYQKTLDEKQARWEADLLTQKPTTWTVMTPTKATSKAGATPAAADKASKLAIQKDGSILASGPIEAVDIYTVTAEFTDAKPATAFRLEVLTDPSLPMKGPGRAGNGNFVLNEIKAVSRPGDKPKEKPKPVRVDKARATVEQDGFPAANAIDNNPATGWAISNGVSNDQAALIGFNPPLNAAKGTAVTFTLDQRYGSGHTIGKFRFSYTTDTNPRLSTPVTPDLAAMLSTPKAERSEKVAKELHTRFLAQDTEYHRLKAEAAKVPPGEARVLGAQDLTWALLNNPAFLFNR